jgi:pimeloyl-ACP methyl ester carboxylesterase
MHLLRARFKKEIVCEFLPPAFAKATAGKPTRKSSRVIILASGIPSVPGRKDVLEFLSKKGYWVFFPRYRGTWESSGHFLSISPHRDLLDIIDELPKGFTSIFDKKRYAIKPSAIYLIGSSFGGAATLLAARDKRVTKAIAFSPVVDWRIETKAEPLDWLYSFMREAFGNGYRMSKSAWNKLKSGRFFNPVHHTKEIPGSKILIIHAKDDDIVPHQSVRKFARQTKSQLVINARGGHLSGSNIITPRYWKLFQKFIRAL